MQKRALFVNEFNIDLGLLNYVHPFDGVKFRRIAETLASSENVEFVSPDAPVGMEEMNVPAVLIGVGVIFRKLCGSKQYNFKLH